MGYRFGFISAALAAALVATSAAACCISEYGAPRTGPVHAIVHQIAVAALKCGGLGTRAAIDRVCARRDRLLERAHMLGWCWGSGSEHFAAEMEPYWLPCRRNRSWVVFNVSLTAPLAGIAREPREISQSAIGDVRSCRPTAGARCECLVS